MPKNQTFSITALSESASGLKDRFAETQQPTIEGARAALETFYYAFNHRSLDLFNKIWLDDSLIQLNNPVGGIVRGAEPISELYARIFNGPVHVQVELTNIALYASSEMVVFAGQERGTYERAGKIFPLTIRTSRIFAYVPEQGGWRQVHHHGSIDSAQELAQYQQAILG